MKKRSITDLLINIVIAELVGALSALLSGGYSDFFDTHKEPPLLPPSWLFPVVWVILYAIMGASAYLIKTADADEQDIKQALMIYYAQLAVNFMWSIVFFRFEALWAAFVVIVVLLVMIALMIVRFVRIRPLSAYMNIPYLIWVAFATYLNLATALIN